MPWTTPSSVNDPDSRMRFAFSSLDSATLRVLVPGPYQSLPVDAVRPTPQTGEQSSVWRRLISSVRTGDPKAKPKPETSAPDVIAVPRADPSGWRELNALAPFTGPVAVTGYRSRLFCLWPNGAVRLFDPTSGQWMTRAHAPTSFVLEYRLALLVDQLHVIGFVPSRDGERPIHLCYNLESDRWIELEPMPTVRLAYAMATIGGALVVAGGHLRDGDRPTSIVEAYFANVRTWGQLPKLPRATLHAAATSAAGRIYVLGGVGHRALGLGRSISRSVQVYTPEIGRWSMASDLPKARQSGRAATCGDRLFLVGGYLPDGQLAPVQVFDIIPDIWDDIPSPKYRRHDSGVAMLDGSLYLIAGSVGAEATASIEAYRIDGFPDPGRRRPQPNVRGTL
jgi:hypothetical protein